MNREELKEIQGDLSTMALNMSGRKVWTGKLARCFFIVVSLKHKRCLNWNLKFKLRILLVKDKTIVKDYFLIFLERVDFRVTRFTI